MSVVRLTALALGASLVISGVFLDARQQGQGQLPSQFPLSLGLRERGSSVTGAFEGWYRSPNGSTALLVGYFNRNSKQELDIPVGPNNRIEPGGPDYGQPTHFQPGRQWGIFSIPVPKDFGEKKLTWTIVANGFTNTITLHTMPDYILEPFEDPANKNTPPSLRFSATGSAVTGPPNGFAATLTAAVGEPLALDAWASDEPPKINASSGRGFGGAMTPILKWSLFRGSAEVKFDPYNPKADKDQGGKSASVATFGAPGEYVLRLQANDATGEGGGGFQCCWTNALVRVIVRPAATQ